MRYMLFIYFSTAGPHDGGILFVIPLELQEIKHQPLPMAQPETKAPVISIWLFHFRSILRYILFSDFSANRLHNRDILFAIPLKFQEIKHQPFPMAQPSKAMPCPTKKEGCVIKMVDTFSLKFQRDNR